MKKTILLPVLCMLVVAIAVVALTWQPKASDSPVVNIVPSAALPILAPEPAPVTEPKHTTALTDYVTKMWSGEYSDREHASSKKPNPDYVVIADVIVDVCGSNPDGICGWPLYVVGPSDWESHAGKQEFYLGQAAGSGLIEDAYLYQGERVALTSHFGPFSDYLKELVEQARRLKEITVDPDLRR